MKRRKRPPQEITFGLIGCGHAGRAFLRLWRAKRHEIRNTYGLSFRLTGIATGSHGRAVDPAGIDPRKVLQCIESGRSLSELHAGRPLRNTLELIRARPAQVLMEMTPLDPVKGQPALDHVRTALTKGMHVVTANKGPVAVAYRELRDLAEAKGCSFRFEGTVMDGTPLFNLVEETLRGTRILGFRGILNSTSNLILTEMEKGRSFEKALHRARAMGITEADPGYDIDGWDAAVKTAVLANVLMGARLHPSQIRRKGIGKIRADDVTRARRRGEPMRLVSRASRKNRAVTARVAPERLKRSDPLAQVLGTSNAIALETDTMKELFIVEKDPGVEQTAYALLSDLLAVAERF